MSSAAELLESYVKKNGWFSVGIIYFDNSFTSNPFSVDGCVCMSKSANMFFTSGKYDIMASTRFEVPYLSTNQKYVGHQQTITCCDLECLQHFDANLFCHERYVNLLLEQEKFPDPKIPTPAEVGTYTPDPDTGLVDGTTTITQLNGDEISVLEFYPDEKVLEYFASAKIIPLQTFYRNQRVFAATCNKFFGLSDCQ